MDPNLFTIFAQSWHPEVQSLWQNMPIPNTWHFCSGDKVHVYELYGPVYKGLLLPESYHNEIGVIHSVDSMQCKVLFGQEIVMLSTVLLQKDFQSVQIVSIPSINSLGLVMDVKHSECSASVLLNDNTLCRLQQDLEAQNNTNSLTGQNFARPAIDPITTFCLNSLSSVPAETDIGNLSSSVGSVFQPAPTLALENTKGSLNDYQTHCSPWITTLIMVVKHLTRKGYRGVVLDVHPDDKGSSGLSVFVQYDIVTVGDKWLDYDDGQHAE
ncbi:hypothetical protein GYMLUDRAFT_252447 [Collybiopsis luxurians FD-317 M1]|uniref:Uncharacterized protein n=1 Tax=Collybiopsis luxurians FD-317 M1 TaxID=944289 RepID=A0A0D0C8H6_9AGAR|nr:hypothetical protein GYMLUDRAFT_252447 [Collybiopsis luxurians FD-317 M1]